MNLAHNTHLGRDQWTLDCDISTQNACEIDKFGEILEEYRKTKPVPEGLSGDKNESGYIDFSLEPKGPTGYTAYIRCPDNSQSKTKCSCKTKAKPGKPLSRKFKCKKLTERKDAKKC